MDDQESAFLVWEHAANLRLDVIAVHESLPISAVLMKPSRFEDIDDAAEGFSDRNFEVVHSGLTFAQETRWQLARFRIFRCLLSRPMGRRR
jgi:hypothetical protein